MEKDSKNDSVNLKKQNIYKYSVFLLAVLLIVGAIYYYNSNNAVIIDSNPVNINIENAPIKGSADAKITLVEFSDYECPFCGRHFLQTYPQIVKNYVETGKVKIAFKDFPLAGHPEAEKASEAAEAVKSQLGDEGYYKMHDKLYSNQQVLSIENYKKWARELGVNGEQFDKDLDSGKFESAVKSDLSEGKKIGVSGTPAFFVNGRAIIGACPYSTFQGAIDAELAGKTWQVDNCKLTVN